VLPETAAPDGTAPPQKTSGLAIVRREVPPGATVRAAGREARLIELPFDAPRVTPA